MSRSDQRVWCKRQHHPAASRMLGVRIPASRLEVPPGQVAERLTHGSAKPGFTGSNPVLASCRKPRDGSTRRRPPGLWHLMARWPSSFRRGIANPVGHTVRTRVQIPLAPLMSGWPSSEAPGCNPGHAGATPALLSCRSRAFVVSLPRSLSGDWCIGNIGVSKTLALGSIPRSPAQPSGA